MLGREPVAGGHDQASGGIGQRAAHTVGGVDAAQGPAAAEEVHKCPKWTFSGRPVDADGQIAVRARKCAVDDLEHRLDRPAARADVREIGGTGLFERHLVKGGRAALGSLVAHSLTVPFAAAALTTAYFRLVAQEPAEPAPSTAAL